MIPREHIVPGLLIAAAIIAALYGVMVLTCWLATLIPTQ